MNEAAAVIVTLANPVTILSMAVIAVVASRSPTLLRSLMVITIGMALYIAVSWWLMIGLHMRNDAIILNHIISIIWVVGLFIWMFRLRKRKPNIE